MSCYPGIIGRQDRGREPDAVGVGSVRLAIAHTRLADRDRTDTGHHLALRQVTVAHDPLVAVRGLQIGILAEKVRDLGLDRLGQQSTRSSTQDFGELIVDVRWLNQLDDVIFGHGISLLWWRSGGVKHPHDMPPSRFPPSPTFSDSSTHYVPADYGDVNVERGFFELVEADAWKGDPNSTFMLFGYPTSLRNVDYDSASIATKQIVTSAKYRSASSAANVH